MSGKESEKIIMVKLGGDASAILKTLDEVEKKIDETKPERSQASNEKNIVVKVGCDTTEFMKAMDEVKKRVDLITSKVKKLSGLISGTDL